MDKLESDMVYPYLFPDSKLSSSKHGPVWSTDEKLANYKLRWNNTWDMEKVKKEAGLMWMIWHKAVAVNAWRGVVSQEIDQSCVVCLKGIKEIVLHYFWECAAAQRAWKWGEAIINSMAPAGVIRGSQAPAPNARMGNAYTSQSPSAGTLLPRSNSIAVDN